MQLATSRLVLREYAVDDWPAVRAYQRDARYHRFYPWTDRSEDEARAYVQMFINLQAEQPRRKFQLAVTLAGSGELIGSWGVRRKRENEWEAEIGYELAPAHWGQGYATEAGRVMLDFGYNRLKLHRIAAICVAGNVASARVLERLGFRLEGRQRENDYFKGQWWDTQIYALLEQEWRQSR